MRLRRLASHVLGVAWQGVGIPLFAWLALKERQVVPVLFEFVWDLGQVWSSWQETTDVGGASEEATSLSIFLCMGVRGRG